MPLVFKHPWQRREQEPLLSSTWRRTKKGNLRTTHSGWVVVVYRVRAGQWGYWIKYMWSDAEYSDNCAGRTPKEAIEAAYLALHPDRAEMH